jgi:DNA uptake protein ComE-like DNA-binding protein
LGVTDVTAATGSAAQLDQSPDARLNQPGTAGAPGNTAVTAEQPPQNAVMELLNHGSEQQLQRVRGVNKSLARKIIGARPYATVEELKKAGASDKLIDELRKAGGVSAAPAAAPATAPAEAQKK